MLSKLNQHVRWIALAVAGITIHGIAHAAQEVGRASSRAESQDGKKSTQRRARGDARKALAAAARLARVPKGSDLATRRAALERALRAFSECSDRFAKNKLVVAESAFRRGQLQWKLQRAAEACAEFARAAEADASAFGARAWLEKAHVERRVKKYTDALASYRRAAKLPGERYAGQARLWVGKALALLGRVPDARESFASIARDARADALLRVRAFDELAMQWIRARDADAAERVLREVETALATELHGEGGAADGLRKRVERMRSRKSLMKLRAKERGKSRSDKR